MDGILLIDKPAGWSSFDVIRRLRRTLGVKKMGHAGTLDPMATGLLIVLIGSACKSQDTFMSLDKAYEAEITLGASSTTDDREGDITSWDVRTKPLMADVDDVLAAFTGQIQQVPPQHSAIKIDGRRAYKQARQGAWVELQPRTVTVHEIADVEYDYPLIHCRCRVSSGTYIRSLARDVGARLGTGGYLSSLRRTCIGDFRVEEALDPQGTKEEIERELRN